jgi:hypothetical protein
VIADGAGCLRSQRQDSAVAVSRRNQGERVVSGGGAATPRARAACPLARMRLSRGDLAIRNTRIQ